MQQHAMSQKRQAPVEMVFFCSFGYLAGHHSTIPGKRSPVLKPAICGLMLQSVTDMVRHETPFERTSRHGLGFMDGLHISPFGGRVDHSL